MTKEHCVTAELSVVKARSPSGRITTDVLKGSLIYYQPIKLFSASLSMLKLYMETPWIYTVKLCYQLGEELQFWCEVNTSCDTVYIVSQLVSHWSHCTGGLHCINAGVYLAPK